jgi:uncharacterized protein involved in type VI secretion and phage assembly
MIGLNLLAGGASTTADRFYGVTIGIVTNNKDDEMKIGRVKVKLPWLSETDESNWARVVSPMAGADRGLYFLPEVGDEVLVAFEHGDIQFPYILGGLWNGKDKPHISNSDGKNNVREIRSRTGHAITLDDTQGEEKITISTKEGKNALVIDASQNTIQITVEKDFTIQAKGNINLKSSGGDVAIECQNFSVDAQQNATIKANSNSSIEAQTGIAIKCMAGVKINDGALEVT